MENLTKEFWDDKYKANEMGWNIGAPSTPLKEYIDTISDKNIKILIPGCGNAYEAEYLFENGFKNVFVLDYSETAVNNFKTRLPNFPTNNVICDDFFNHKGKYDLIIEQTFFCAISPNLRKSYVKQMFELLNPNGLLAGLFFNDEKLNLESPPFRFLKDEYIELFSKHFNFNKFEDCKNSIKPRAGRELFFIFEKK